MFSKVLIANRGAIACRIIRSLQKLNVKSVVVYAEDDVDSLHIDQADEAYSLGAGRVNETYLNQEKIIAIAQSCGAEAIHPGYGFLSENVEFVQRCDQAGIGFIGPRAHNIQKFGLKHEARLLAQNNDVPMLPGSGLLDSLQQAKEHADMIHYPVMLKSTAGGGGIGMQLCHNEQQLEQAYESVRRLSQNNFAHTGIFLEKYIAQARHIEVQIFGDGEGQVIALGERDCSSQRRNQKVIEECPAPNLSDENRQAMHDTAVRLMQSVAYRNAGTVEYIYDVEEECFYFLEVNTRLQVEHGVTEEVFGVDLVEWMILLAAGELSPLDKLKAQLQNTGHSIQARLYAEDPHKGFQPSSGLLTQVLWPEPANDLRIDTWVATGCEISPQYDPMLAKIIVKADTRTEAIEKLKNALQGLSVEGIEHNAAYIRSVLDEAEFSTGRITTHYLAEYTYQSNTIDIIHPGTQTTVQDYPGRVGYWAVGIPPSGPFDSLSFRLGNQLLGNREDAAGLEFTIQGASLRFNQDSLFILTGAEMTATLDDQSISFWHSYPVKAGQILKIGKTKGAGARAYLLIKNGIQCASYLGSRSTFTLGRFGGHGGRALNSGDVLHILPSHEADVVKLDQNRLPSFTNQWKIQVIYGPHGAPDFFTEEDIKTFFSTEWSVHYNSSRTGIRLIGPKPQWARSDGGEAGMHPSNIHDNAYAIGSIDFTGDMPVILGPDGPSLGGFVCPATVIQADLWKLGQLKAGDKIQFVPVYQAQAVDLSRSQNQSLQQGRFEDTVLPPNSISSPILRIGQARQDQVIYRPAGENYLLVEFGDLILDIRLRFRVHSLMHALESLSHPNIRELTPGIRSLQIHYNSQELDLNSLIRLLAELESKIGQEEHRVTSRIVHLPLSWNDEACQQAVEKYMRSVRQDAPWCPDNIEFIRRINGLESVDAVKEIVFNANYLVMGLGDVYLGAPVATPIDPRHRLVTTKYNPARTWTAENSVGIGGSYLCIYGMEGPGGYQFIGRTLQMWNRFRKTHAFSKPWLLRFFDQIRFFPVSHEELEQIRRDFPRGRYDIKIEETTFDLKEYEAFLQNHASAIGQFNQKRQQAFDAELQRWIESGQIHFQSEGDFLHEEAEEEAVPENCLVVESPVAGNIWKVQVQGGEYVNAGDCVMVLESMKMEIEVCVPESGHIYAINRTEGQQVTAGQALIILQKDVP